MLDLEALAAHRGSVLGELPHARQPTQKLFESRIWSALTGFDRREVVTIPSLPDAAQWEAFEAARQAMVPNFAQEHAAARYRA